MRLVVPTLPPADVAGLDAVVVLEERADPERGGDLILDHADGAADQVLRRLDATVRVHVDVPLPECAGREHRQTDEAIIAPRLHDHVRRERQLGRVELCVLGHATEDLADPIDAPVELDACRRDLSRDERMGPVEVRHAAER